MEEHRSMGYFSGKNLAAHSFLAPEWLDWASEVDTVTKIGPEDYHSLKLAVSIML